MLTTPDRTVLDQWAYILQHIRAFFLERGVLEVSTPLLRAYTVSDPHIAAIPAGNDWLQTSPEYAMKCLLCAHPNQPIYQLCKAFRQDSTSKWHRSEFQMVEWYRPQWSYLQLLQEVLDLIGHLAGRTMTVERMSYQEAFLRWAGIDPLTCARSVFQEIYRQKRPQAIVDIGEDSILWEQMVFTDLVEVHFQHYDLVALYDYPPHLAALAELESGVAQRFEVYWRGVELANGYQELRTVEAYESRFAADNARRHDLGLAICEPDTELLQALSVKALPYCSGVALGVDRLVACSLGRNGLC